MFSEIPNFLTHDECDLFIQLIENKTPVHKLLEAEVIIQK